MQEFPELNKGSKELQIKKHLLYSLIKTSFGIIMKALFKCLLFVLVASTSPLLALWVVNESSITLYSEPQEFTLVEDIVGYGQFVEPTETKGEWVLVNVPKTGWHGWTRQKYLLELDHNPHLDANAWVGFKGAYVYHTDDTIYGLLFELPYETPIQIVEELPQQNNRWMIIKLHDGKKVYIQRGQVQFTKPLMSLDEAVEFSLNFMNTKYIFGGTTSLGYDCSGFVQMIYAQMGLKIPRNSRYQARDTQFIDVALADAKKGDLLFFKKDNDRVVHVGMMINDKKFIHSFPRDGSCISISDITEERFVNGEYTKEIFLRRFNSEN